MSAHLGIKYFGLRMKRILNLKNLAVGGKRARVTQKKFYWQILKCCLSRILQTCQINIQSFCVQSSVDIYWANRQNDSCSTTRFTLIQIHETNVTIAIKTCKTFSYKRCICTDFKCSGDQWTYYFHDTQQSKCFIEYIILVLIAEWFKYPGSSVTSVSESTFKYAVVTRAYCYTVESGSRIYLPPAPPSGSSDTLFRVYYQILSSTTG